VGRGEEELQYWRAAVKDEFEAVINQMVENGISYVGALREFEKPFIKTILDRHQGNQSKAAKALGIHRNTLSRKIREFGLNAQPKHRRRSTRGRKFVRV
jgi:DNA-binding protein Fis